MFTLHYAPDNASLIVRLALEESGLPYRTELVDRAARAQDSAAYRRMNPAGLIPVLETPQGPLFETGAILLWLADTVAPMLGPAPGAPERGAFLKWLFFLSNTAHADLRQIFYPEYFVPPGAEAGHRALLTARLRRHYALLDAAAAESPALFAPPSALGIYAATLLRWSIVYTDGHPPWLSLADVPALAAICDALDARPATRRAAAAEDLGDRPFSHPAPEGRPS